MEPHRRRMQGLVRICWPPAAEDKGQSKHSHIVLQNIPKCVIGEMLGDITTEGWCYFWDDLDCAINVGRRASSEGLERGYTHNGAQKPPHPGCFRGTNCWIAGLLHLRRPLSSFSFIVSYYVLVWKSFQNKANVAHSGPQTKFYQLVRW